MPHLYIITALMFFLSGSNLAQGEVMLGVATGVCGIITMAALAFMHHKKVQRLSNLS